MSEQTDLEWLLALGVPIENIAARTGRTTTAIQAELETTRAARRERAE